MNDNAYSAALRAQEKKRHEELTLLIYSPILDNMPKEIA